MLLQTLTVRALKVQHVTGYRNPVNREPMVAQMPIVRTTIATLDDRHGAAKMLAVLELLCGRTETLLKEQSKH